MPGKAACISATPKPITTALIIKPSAVGNKNLRPHPIQIVSKAPKTTLRSPTMLCTIGPINAMTPINIIGNKVSKAIPCRLNPVPARILETNGPMLVTLGLTDCFDNSSTVRKDRYGLQIEQVHIQFS